MSYGVDRPFRLRDQTAAVGLTALFALQSVLLFVLQGNTTWMVIAWQLSAAFNAFLQILIATYRFRRSIHLKAHWALFAAFNVLSVLGDGFDSLSYLLLRQATSLYVSSGRDLLNLAALIPLFLLVSLPAGRRYFRSFLWIDAGQAVLIACCLYALIFHALPFVQAPDEGAGAIMVVRLLEIGGGCITIGGFLHYVAAIDVAERKFYGILTVILAMATASLILNDEISLYDSREIWTNIVVYFQWNLAAWFLFRLPLEQSVTSSGRVAGLLADIINIGSPVMSSAILLALGIAVQPRQPALGLAAIIAAFAAFAVRSTLYLRSFEQAQRSLETLSYTDQLTGVANRRAFDSALEMEWQRGLRSGTPLSLLLIDVDHFKQLNDIAGHQAGDLILKQIANALRIALPRSIDVLGRYGGDEFAAILPSTNGAAAEVVAERLVNVVRALALPHPATTTGYATISLGIGSYNPAAGERAVDLLAAADSALYEAKAAGRNGWRSHGL